MPNMNSIMKNNFLCCFNHRNKKGNSGKYPFQIHKSYSHCIKTENKADEGDSNGANLPKVLQVQGGEVVVNDPQPSSHIGKQK